MTARIVGMLAALTLVAVQPLTADDKVQAELQGVYTVEKAVREGMSPSGDELGSITFEFKANKIILKSEQRDQESEYTLDAKKTPREIAIKMPNGREAKGIFKLEGDTLTLCVGTGDEAVTKFEAPEGSKAMLLVLKRQKK